MTNNWDQLILLIYLDLPGSTWIAGELRTLVLFSRRRLQYRHGWWGIHMTEEPVDVAVVTYALHENSVEMVMREVFSGVGIPGGKRA